LVIKLLSDKICLMVSGELPQKEEKVTGAEITLIKGTTQVFVKPKEGGIVSRFRVDNVDIFFPNQYFQTEDDIKRRGGNPFLFPNAGPLPKGNKELPNLKQHGFARNKAWTVKDISPGRDFIVLGLTSDDETKALYPYDFEVELRISVDEGRLRYDLQVTNNSDEPMPIAPGFHPYFQVPIEKREEVKTNIPGFNPAEFDWNSSPDFPRQAFVLLQVPDSGEVSIKSSEEFQKLVVWSEPDRPYLCVEPRTREDGAILDPEERIEIQTGETANFWIEIGFQKASG